MWPLAVVSCLLLAAPAAGLPQSPPGDRAESALVDLEFCRSLFTPEEAAIRCTELEAPVGAGTGRQQHAASADEPAPAETAEDCECALAALCPAENVVRAARGSAASCQSFEVCCASEPQTAHLTVQADSPGQSDADRCLPREIPDEGGAEQFPWFVSLVSDRGETVGSGVLIHHRLVLTAAHVLERGDQLWGRLGQRRGQPDSGQLRPVLRNSSHPDHSRRSLYHDVALLLLDLTDPAPDTATVCLGPPSLDPAAPLALADCRTVSRDDEKSGGALQVRHQQLVHRRNCEQELRDTKKVKDTFGLHFSFTCARTDYGTQSACRVEAGAPLTCTDPRDRQRDVLVGLFSWNASCRGTLGWPDVFARLADVDNYCWIGRSATDLLGLDRPFFTDELCTDR